MSYLRITLSMGLLAMTLISSRVRGNRRRP